MIQMKNTIYFFLITISLINCSTKKTETSQSTADSVAMDSSILATTPATSLLAFSPLEGFSPSNKLDLPDSVNYFIFSSLEEMKGKFALTAADGDPDFVINYVVGIACKPTTSMTTIVMDKVEIGPESIEVYLTIQHGEQQKLLTRPARIFAIERRDGYSEMQFYVNGKKDKALLLLLTE